MVNVKYTNSKEFRCLEDMSAASMEIDLVHMGKEECKPYHAISGTRDEYIIHFVMSGSGFYSVGGMNYSITAGQMFLIYPDTPIVYCSDVNDPWSYMWIGFKGLRTDAILKQCGFSTTNHVLPAPAPEKLYECFDELFNHIVQNYAESLYREATLLRLLALLAATHQEHLEALGVKSEVFGKSVHLDSAIEFINTHYQLDISVEDIASHVRISRGYLNHLFKDKANMTAQDYLIEFRMYKAANLLVSTTLSISEVANRVGYNDPLVFSKAFKRQFGMSPKNYRLQRIPVEVRTARPGDVQATRQAEATASEP